MVTLRRMLTSLSDQLSILCAPLGASDEKLTNQMIADIGNSPSDLETVFQCLSKGVCLLGEAVVKGVEINEVHVHQVTVLSTYIVTISNIMVLRARN